VFTRRTLPVLLALAAVAVGSPAAAADHEGLKPRKAPAAFVSLHQVDPTILLDIRYYTNHNFVGRRIHGYRDPICILTRPAAEGLKRVQAALVPRGYTLKVYDCYRPQRAVNDFVRWAERLNDQKMKREFYPRVDKSRLFADGYIAERSGHSRGSTMDLTLVKLPPRRQPRWSFRRFGLVPCFAPYRKRFPDNTIDMGTGYDCFDTLAHTLDPRIQGKQLANRLLLKSAMEAAGFTNYANEWWHYTLNDEPFPDTYFDFPVSCRSLHKARHCRARRHHRSSRRAARTRAG
jgi:zinc D-Ala-D-Ala dipeptidase